MHARLIACGLSFMVLFGILPQRGLGSDNGSS